MDTLRFRTFTQSMYLAKDPETITLPDNAESTSVKLHFVFSCAKMCKYTYVVPTVHTHGRLDLSSRRWMEWVNSLCSQKDTGTQRQTQAHCVFVDHRIKH